MAEINMGTMYDLNKGIFAQKTPLTKEERDKKFSDFVLLNFMHKHEYYMLLCHEEKDYTVFHIGGKNDLSFAGSELRETLENRGAILDIYQTEQKDAYEIWIRNLNNEPHMYYLFPYDFGIVEA